MRMIHILTIIDISIYILVNILSDFCIHTKNHIYKVMQYMLFSTLLFKTNQR